MISSRPRTCTHCGGTLIRDDDVAADSRWTERLVCLLCGRVAEERLAQRIEKRGTVTDTAQRENGLDGWEVYDKRKASAAIRVSRNGQITLTATAHDLIGNPTTVDLLFHRGRRAIGIRKGSGPGAFAASAFKGSGGVNIGCKSFLEHYEIEITTGLKLKATVEDGVLVAALPRDVA